jgi:hypothetical protein
MLNIAMLSVVMLNVAMLSVVMLTWCRLSNLAGLSVIGRQPEYLPHSFSYENELVPTLLNFFSSPMKAGTNKLECLSLLSVLCKFSIYELGRILGLFKNMLII